MANSPAISLTILETGRVRVRPTMLTQPATRPVFLRRLRFLTDRRWTPWLPVYAFLISHPDGPILFDAGMSPRCKEAGYFPLWMPTFKLTSEIEIEEKEGIAEQLLKLGIQPTELKNVVLSHLHYDHCGGLPDLIGVPVSLHKDHWEAFRHPFHATMEGAVPNQWPKDFSPKFLEPTGSPLGPFERTYPITADGKVVAVETPGHVPGHLSVIVYADEATYFLTGDATYSQEDLDKELTDGVNDDPLRAVESVKKIKELARQLDIVVLPAHDVNGKKRKEVREVYKPTTL